MKKITKIGVMSWGKLMGFIYGVIGFIGGAVISLITLAAGSDSPGASMFFGGLAIIFIPLLYGVLGFIFGMIFAVIYNFAAKYVGGLEIELEEVAVTPSFPAPTPTPPAN